ncbi:lisH domain and HEAT repeat-containing protein KIAA1468-like protein [Sarcoptes scabiei]|uniref:LisH domain and HEAT repeat-containing protein KIAA1468-like protein n=1 Tax=Sarcoptes scabiei TaxID=52283 RepID=A0A132A7P6_SARSC|nr:lisH domain and HEAT repeat-containing protein KIAA1468-like protein [Sarcoptes scabiei]
MKENEDNFIINDDGGVEKCSASESNRIGAKPISETEIFERIAQKLLRSGFLLTALEFHAELIEQGKESQRLREFFDNPHNFERNFGPTQSSKQPYSSSSLLSSFSGTGMNPQQSQSMMASTSSTLAANSKPIDSKPTSPSEKTFDSFEFTHYSDDDFENHRPVNENSERIAVLEFELRKAQQTINSLRASLTMSTTGHYSDEDLANEIDFNHQHQSNKNESANIVEESISSNSMPQLNETSELQLSNQIHKSLHHHPLIRDFGFRGSADGDSFTGDDDKLSKSLKTNTSDVGFDHISSHNEKFSSTLIKQHEKRTLNFLINEYLMDNNYKLTSITFCDENTDQDFDRWDDVGLNIERPPELLRLYRNYWRNRSECLHRSQQNQTQSLNHSVTSNSISISKNISKISKEDISEQDEFPISK